MKTKPPKFLPALTFLFLFIGPSVVFADDFQDAQDSYNRKDYKTARKLWTQLAEKGDGKAQTNLGWIYEKGKGVTQDNQKAAKWYRLAAEQGFALAQFNL